jgi:hypothetical protein
MKSETKRILELAIKRRGDSNITPRELAKEILKSAMYEADYWEDSGSSFRETYLGMSKEDHKLVNEYIDKLRIQINKILKPRK